MSDITTLPVQREIKPNIEDVLPYYLEGGTLNAALDYVNYLRENKMNLKWAGIHNAWKAACKGKPIIYVRLDCKHRNEDKTAKWAVVPYLVNMHEYEDEIIMEGLQDLVCDGFWRCITCAYGCNPGADKTIAGNELTGLCCGNFYSGRNWVWFYDPDETTISCTKKLLDMEKKARA